MLNKCPLVCLQEHQHHHSLTLSYFFNNLQNDLLDYAFPPLDEFSEFPFWEILFCHCPFSEEMIKSRADSASVGNSEVISFWEMTSLLVH